MQEKIDETSQLMAHTAPYYTTFVNSSWWNEHLAAKNWRDYLPQRNNVGYAAASMIITLSFLPYSLTPTPASDLINDVWWSSLTPLNQAFLISLVLLCFFEGSAARYKYLQMMWDNLKKILGQCFDSLSDFLLSMLTIIVAGIAAIPLAALGYLGATWAGQILAFISGALNFFMTWVLRMVFLPTMVMKFRGLFDEKKQFQKQLIHHLDSLQPEEALIINQRLAKIDPDLLNEELISFLLQHIFNEAQHNSMFVQNNTLNRLKTGFAAVISTIAGAAFFLFLSQAGYEGAKLLCFVLSDNCFIDQLHYAAKLALICIPGLSASVVGFMPTFELLNETLVDVFCHLKQKPRDIWKVLLLLGVCSLTAMSFYNAAIGMANKPNLFALTSGGITFLEKIFYTLYCLGNYGVGIVLEWNIWLKMLGLNEDVTTAVTLNKTVQWLRKNPLPENRIESLQAHGFFRQDAAKFRKNMSEHIVDNVDEMQSVHVV